MRARLSSSYFRWKASAGGLRAVTPRTQARSAMAPALLLSGGSNAGSLSNIFAKLLVSLSLVLCERRGRGPAHGLLRDVHASDLNSNFKEAVQKNLHTTFREVDMTKVTAGEFVRIGLS